MKHLSIIASALFLSFAAYAADPVALDDIVKNQETVEITPVTYMGNAVSPQSAGTVCSLAGYTAIRSFRITTIHLNKTPITTLGSTAYSHAIQATTQTLESGDYNVLASVTCAR